MHLGVLRRGVYAAIGVCLLVAATARVSAAATIYYVSPSGNDSSPGTETQPFRTIQRAASLVNPGDTVIVEDGTYTGSGTQCGVKTIVCVSRGGTSTAGVTFRARNVGGARIDGQDNTFTDGFYFSNSASYVTIDGFEIFGMGIPAYATSGGAHGVMIDNGHDITLSRLEFHDIGRTCTSTTNGLSGVFVRVPKVTITRSAFHDIGRFQYGENGCTLTIKGSLDHGIYVNGSYVSSTTPGASDVLISNNIFHHTQRGWSVQLYPGTLTRISVLNNTFAFANPYQDGQIVLGASTVDSRIENNIFFQPRTAAIFNFTGTQTNLQVRNNVISSGSIFTSTPGSTTVSGTIVADPKMINTSVAPYDFELMSSSPALAVGLTLSEVPDDFAGLLRPTGAYDIGAYQLLGSTAPTSPDVVATPTITPDGGTLTGPVNVSLSTSTSGATIRYTTDGSLPGSTSPTYTAPFTISSAMTVKAQAVKSGMADSFVAEAVFQATSDTTAPAVAFTSPANGARVWKNTSLAASASDNVGVASVRFALDGKTISTDTSAPYNGSYNFNKVSAGAHVLTATATDAAGNATTASITVYK